MPLKKFNNLEIAVLEKPHVGTTGNNLCLSSLPAIPTKAPDMEVRPSHPSPKYLECPQLTPQEARLPANAPVPEPNGNRP